MALATTEAVDALEVSKPLRDAYGQFLASTLERSPKTVTKYDQILCRLAQHLDDGDLAGATETGLQRVFATSAWFASLTSSSKHTALTAVNGFYTWLAEDAGLLERAPTAALHRLHKRLPATRRRLPTYLTMPEVTRLLQAMDGHLHAARDQAVTAVLAYAGGRLTETVGGLQLCDIDLHDGVIYFRNQTKNDKDRTVPINPLLRLRLAAWLRCREDMPGVEVLFTSGHGGPIRKPHQWAGILHRAAVRAGLQWVTCDVHGRDHCEPKRHGSADGCRDAGWRVHPHALRHSFAIEALRSGACTLAELRDLLGHTSIATTNVYLQIVHDQTSSERFRRRFGKGER